MSATLSIGPQTVTITTRDGRALHAERAGTGAPVVVFESGMGMSRHTWGAVAPLVAAQTTTVVYDRSGLGRSPVAAAPRDLEHLAADLCDVLAALGAGPFVLVGHSWGGPIIRQATAATAPGTVAGLVLVDQSDERCDLFFGAGNARQGKVAKVVAPALARTRILRLVMRRLAATLPEPAATGLRTEDGTLAATRTQLAEMEPSIADLRRLRDDPPAMPDIPVTVISGTVTTRFERSRRPALVAAHEETAAAFPQGRHVRAERSSHYVPFTEAELVAAEVLRVVELARAH